MKNPLSKLKRKPEAKKQKKVSKLKRILQKRKEQLKRISGYVTSPYKTWLKDGNARARARYAYYYKKLKIQEKTVLYESFMGRGLVCNPYAMFCNMLQDEKYNDYTHVWVLDDLANHEIVIAEYAKYSNVKFIKYQSREHLKALASAKILINNVSFWAYFVKKENQIYINTWHGIPLKHLGYDMPDGILASKNMVRSFLQADYLLSANSFSTKIYKDSYKINEIYAGKILEEGYPRNDILTSDREYVLTKLKKFGVTVDPKKKIVLYAPTWRGKDFTNPQDDVDSLLLFHANLTANIDTKEYQVLIKPHHVLGKLFKEKGKYDFVIPANFDGNEALSVSDILISDYSSIFFDFLTTNRPILFYVTDLVEYEEDRGLYFGLDELPAPHTDKIAQLAKWITSIENFQQENAVRYKKMRDFCENTDKTYISENIWDIILQKKPPTVEVPIESGKIKILIFKGSPLLNGIGTSAYNLLNYIDYSKYDVTLYMYPPTNQEQRNYIEQVNKQCRVIIQHGAFTATLSEQSSVNLTIEYCFTYLFIEKIYPKLAFIREARRAFGDSRFDYLMDFDGYSRKMSLIALEVPVKKRYIWQHNDMVSEQNMKYPWIKHLFSLYQKFDGIVSCAKSTMEINRKKLSTPETYNKYTYATNLFDVERVLSSKVSSLIYKIGEIEYLPIESTSDVKRLVPLTTSLKNTKQKLLKNTWKNGIAELNEMTFNQFENTTKFVTVGRCSPEKNHIALIDGFELLLEVYPNVMLYIVGNGPDFKKEYDYILKKKLEKHIVMTSNLKDPFALMKECDCFILPSLHEGQPIVLLEARMLGMPIIMSNFSTAKSSQMPNGQLMIGKEKNDIYKGMKAFIQGEVPCDYHFDVDEYNKQCYSEFEALLK